MMKRLLIMIAIVGLLASLSCAAYAAPASIETAGGTTGYQYGIDNFIGLNAPSNLEANYSTMQETTLNGVAPVDNVLFLRYDNQLIFDKYSGFYVVNPSADDTIYSMAFG